MSIIIDHLRQVNGHDTLFTRLAEILPKEQIALSVLSVQELFEGKSTRDIRKEQHLLMTITPCKILPYTFEIVMHAERIGRDLKRPIEFVDSAIAATG